MILSFFCRNREQEEFIYSGSQGGGDGFEHGLPGFGTDSVHMFNLPPGGEGFIHKEGVNKIPVANPEWIYQFPDPFTQSQAAMMD